MSPDLIFWIGILASLCTSPSNVFQVLKVYRRKSSSDLSLGTMIMVLTGNSLWLIYGIFLQSIPLIFASCVGLTLISILLYLYFKFRNNIPGQQPYNPS